MAMLDSFRHGFSYDYQENWGNVRLPRASSSAVVVVLVAW
jgi:hypothetical protein